METEKNHDESELSELQEQPAETSNAHVPYNHLLNPTAATCT